MAAKAPDYHHHHAAMAPILMTSASSTSSTRSHSSKDPIDFSPPLIAMVVVAAAAFLFVTYSRLISRFLSRPLASLLRRYRQRRRRRRFHFPPSDVESPPPAYLSDGGGGFLVYSPCPFGLDDAVISNLPLSVYRAPKKSFVFHDCAVCLIEFEDGDYLRTLPLCSHFFHVDCIDMWLRSHATCPMCRAGVFLPEKSPMIRPILDDGLLFLEPLMELPEFRNSGEIREEISPRRSERRSLDGRRESDFLLLKRSYSFGFERSFASERMVLEAATTPYHHHRNRRRSFFWTKRPSTTPYSSMAKSRVFSSRHGSRGERKSPVFFRIRNGGGGSSRRGKFFAASPVFGSRVRCGDPEALISPERFGGR